VPKNTSTGSNGGRARRAGAEATVEHAQRESQRIRRAAEADAARIRGEAEEHARRLVIDARASADGVRAEGMELVSHLREMGDALRSNADRLLRDIQAIHSRMVGELERAAPDEAPQPPGEAPAPTDDEVLDVPDFVSRG
jgi:cell division septum initiation protein DivIVA